ncbi:hypothetical protein L1987_28711 [Smallanthus sonchifolius]|uniref:Uncharacterized protein n=1 Tax=Smallanthus sonchifolius TaxID=185202 RepID=A0ACB9HXC9_9ASTR|nr:hypothetical protein L1987_28711 [Smallanthus sonchifolius]
MQSTSCSIVILQPASSEEKTLVKKFLHALPKKFIHMVASIEQLVDLKTVGFDNVLGRLIAYEERVNQEDKQPNKGEQLLFTFEEWEARRKHNKGYGRSKGAAEPSNRGRGRGKIIGGGHSKEKEQGEKRDLSKIKCFRCDGMGHYSSDCPTRKKNEESNLSQADEHATGSGKGPVLYMITHVDESKDVVFLNEERVDPRVYESSPCEDNTWFLDNGTSNHMTGNQEWFSNLDSQITEKVKFGDGSCVEIKGRGKIVLEGKSGEQRTLEDVYFIPSLKNNIISVGHMALLFQVKQILMLSLRSCLQSRRQCRTPSSSALQAPLLGFEVLLR